MGALVRITLALRLAVAGYGLSCSPASRYTEGFGLLENEREAASYVYLFTIGLDVCVSDVLYRIN